MSEREPLTPEEQRIRDVARLIFDGVQATRLANTDNPTFLWAQCMAASDALAAAGYHVVQDAIYRRMRHGDELLAQVEDGDVFVVQEGQVVVDGKVWRCVPDSGVPGYASIDEIEPPPVVDEMTTTTTTEAR